MNKKEFKQYTCIKSVMAAPCTRKEAEKIIGRLIREEDCEDEDGYLVTYKDGYMSWSPAQAFTDGYVVTDNYIDRMKFELSELRERIVKGMQFYLQPIRGGDFNYKLREQLEAMSQYADVLIRRIYDAEQAKQYQLNQRSNDEQQQDIYLVRG